MSTPAPDSSLSPALEHVRREALRFAEVAARSPLPAHVPAYPAFTVETLTAHIGRVLRGFPALLAPGSEAAPQEAPDGPAVIEWASGGLEPLLTLLSEIPPETPVTFPHGRGERPASRIAPLLAVEVGVHRWDLETVLGEHDPVPAGDLALIVWKRLPPPLSAATVTGPADVLQRFLATGYIPDPRTTPAH
jgi:Mycothiol maleylpyruvate isomerase N-terminal domain